MNVSSNSTTNTKSANAAANAQTFILQRSVNDSLSKAGIESFGENSSFYKELQSKQTDATSNNSETSKTENKEASATTNSSKTKSTNKSVNTNSDTQKSDNSDKVIVSNNNEKNSDNSNENNNKQENEFLNESKTGGVNYTDYKYGNKSQDLLSQNIRELLNTRNMINENTSFQGNTLDYSTINMSDNDAKFFVDLVNNSDKTMQGLTQEIQKQMETPTKEIQTSSKISQTLLDTIKEGMKTNQPFRIDFDKDVSVILQIDKKGTVSANFIPGDKAVEQYLKNNIDYLRQTFNEENIPYNNLSYSEQKQQQEQRNRRNNNNKENE